MSRQTKQISISLLPEFLKKIDHIAGKENRTRSELFREALRRYIADREWQEMTRNARLKAPRGKIENEEDVNRVVLDTIVDPAAFLNLIVTTT